MQIAYTLHMTTNVQIRIDKALKIKAEKTLERIGLDLPTAFRAFLKKVNLVGGMPFSLIDDADRGYYSYTKEQEDQILNAFKEAKKNPSKSKTFTNGKDAVAYLRRLK